MKKALALTIYFGLVAVVLAGSLLLSKRIDPEELNHPVATPTEEPMSNQMLYLDEGAVFSWKDGRTERISEAQGAMELRSLRDGFVMTVPSERGYDLVFVRGGEKEVVYSSSDFFDIETDGDSMLSYATGESTVVRDMETGQETSYPVSDSWKIIPGKRAIVASSGGMAWLRDGDQEVPLGSGAEIISAMDDRVFVMTAERYRWVMFSGGEREVPVILGGHIDAMSPLGDAGVIQVFSQKDENGYLTQMEAAYEKDGKKRRVALSNPPGALVQACGSPDGSMIAVVGSSDVKGSYLQQSWSIVRPSNLGIVVYDTKTGERIDDFPGGTISWCPGDDLWWQHPEAHIH